MDSDADALSQATRPSFEDRMLAHPERQTKALEALQQFALRWTVVAVLGGLVWLIVAVNNGM